MKSYNFKIKLDEGAKAPEKAHDSDAGFDLFANIKPYNFNKIKQTNAVLVDDQITIKAGGRALIPTGVRIALPEGWEAQVRPRSGSAINSGITVLNSPGTIDAGYRGEIGVILINTSNDLFSFEDGAKIAQLVINKVPKTSLTVVEDIDNTERGEKGFGSTGV